nr:MAG TPA: hypothetical protein [Caudoviricetes sp.]
MIFSRKFSRKSIDTFLEMLYYNIRNKEKPIIQMEE